MDARSVKNKFVIVLPIFIYTCGLMGCQAPWATNYNDTELNPIVVTELPANGRSQNSLRNSRITNTGASSRNLAGNASASSKKAGPVTTPVSEASENDESLDGVADLVRRQMVAAKAMNDTVRQISEDFDVKPAGSASFSMNDLEEEAPKPQSTANPMRTPKTRKVSDNSPIAANLETSNAKPLQPAIVAEEPGVQSSKVNDSSVPVAVGKPKESHVAQASLEAPIAIPEAVETVSAESPMKPSQNQEDWRTLIRRATAALESSSINETPDQLRHREIFKRYLQLAVGDIDAAMTPIEDMSTEEQEYFRNSLQALFDATDPTGNPVKNRRYTLVMQSQRQAAGHLANLCNLEVNSVAFCTEVESFGVITQFEQYKFKADQEVLLYCEVDNFVAESVKTGYQTQLQGSYEITDSSGRRVADQLLPLDEHVCKNWRRDYFIPYRMYMPQDIKPGKYQLKLTIEDMKGRKFGQSKLDFEIIP